MSGPLAFLPGYLEGHRARIDEALEGFFPAPGRWPAKLHEACAWPLFGGGKRLRPVLTLAAFEAAGGLTRHSGHRPALPPACAVEMVHTYSLVHDDLPCMDDDDERRGRPTTHVRFGEALALLAGDALLTEAFSLVGRRDAYAGTLDDPAILDLSAALARAAGWLGMVGGQSFDLGFEGPVDTEEAVAFLHRRKTGELFRFSLFAGARAAGAPPDDIERLADYGELLGLAFQVADDVLDDDQDQTERGDEAGDTPSFVTLLGIDGARARAQELHDQARALLDGFGPAAEPLRHLAWYAVNRDR